MPRKVYPKLKLLFNLTTTVHVHYVYTDLRMLALAAAGAGGEEGGRRRGHGALA